MEEKQSVHLQIRQVKIGHGIVVEAYANSVRIYRAGFINILDLFASYRLEWGVFWDECDTYDIPKAVLNFLKETKNE